jgi:hypothetical protein
MEGVAAQMPCLIQPACGSGLALSVTGPDSRVYVTTTASPPGAGQLWQFVPFSPHNEPLGLVLVNGLSGQAAYPPAAPGENSYVLTEDTGDVTVASLWEVSPRGRMETKFRIFALGDGSRNLNVANGQFSCSDGDAVIVLQWGGGQPNESWELTPVQPS